LCLESKTGTVQRYTAVKHLQARKHGLQDAVVTGVDPNGAMFGYAQTAAEQAGMATGQLMLREGVLEHLPESDSAFDRVVCTLTLCSVKSQEMALAEIQRVLRPGGKLMFIEHVASFKPGGLQLAQRLLDPLQHALADGCHLTRHTGEAMEGAGFARVDLKRVQLEDSLISPRVWGTATLA
jgi:SAM-dependent methyltransferase